MDQLPSQPTQKAMVIAARSVNRPMTLKEIAFKAGLSYQGANNHIGALVESGWFVKLPNGDTGKGFLYSLSGGMGSSATLYVNGKYVSILELLEDTYQNGYPKNVFERALRKIIVQMYIFSIGALDNEPRPITNEMMKDLSLSFHKIVNRLSEILAFARAIESNSRLWDIQLLPKTLIMHDPDVRINDVIEMLKGISGGKTGVPPRVQRKLDKESAAPDNGNEDEEF